MAKHIAAAAVMACALVATAAHAQGSEGARLSLGQGGVTFAKAYGPGFPTMDTPAREPNGEMSLITKKSLGCLGVGTAATAVALVAAPDSAIFLIGGGLVPILNPTVLYLGLGGVVFASFCAIGHAVTPMVLHYFETPVHPPGPTQPGACINCREARPYAPTVPASAAWTVVAPARAAPAPAAPASGGGPAFVSGLAALKAALR